MAEINPPPVVPPVAPAVTRSWRTTAAGVLAALALIGPQLGNLLDEDPATVCSWPVVISAVMVALGFAAARDSGVSSEKAGAK